MTPRIRLVSALVLAACAVTAAVAIAGAADPTATQSLGLHEEETGIWSLAARADGGILAVQDRRIESFRADGTPGPKVAQGLAPAEGTLYPAAGGKTLVLGYKKLTRLDPDGSVDKSFGVDGTIEVPYGAAAVHELGSGRIAVVSTVVGGAKSVYAYVSVELLNQDGSVEKGAGFSSSLDASGVPLGGSIEVPEISSTSDGGALAVGQDFLLELNADGSVNGGFGDGGVMDEAFGLVGGHVLAGGSVETVGTDLGVRSADIVLRRYTAAGEPDTAFGPEGARRFALGDGRGEAGVASWGADGSVIVGGKSVAPGPCPEEECEEVPIIASFSAAGEREAAFAEGGVLRLAALAGPADGSFSRGVTAIARRADGSIVAAGNAPPNRTTGFLVAVSPQGALLPGFGEGGIVRNTDARPAELALAGFVPRPHGAILGLGTTDVGIGDAPVLVRFTSGNRLDRSFGDGTGYVILREAQGRSPHGATGFAIDGNEVLTGVYDYPRSHLLMARAEDGSPVASFGSGGTVDLPSEVWAQAVAFAPGGDPVVLARRRVAGPASAEPGVILRLAPDGGPDKGFRRGGRFTMRLGHQAVRGKALLTGPGDRILASGSLGHRFAIVSLLPAGRPDPRFGSGGWSVVKVGSPTHYMTLGRVGRHIYLAGAVGEKYGRQEVMLMRFDRHGHLDKRFGRGGRLVAPLTSPGHPVGIVPTREGILVVLSGGRRPLLTFSRRGKIRRRALAAGQRFVGDVRAAVADGTLVLGWRGGDRAYHLTRRPLDRLG